MRGADAADVIAATADELAGLREEVALFDIDRLARLLEILGEVAAQIRWAPDPRLVMEVALTRMARPAADLTLTALAERVTALESGVPASVAVPSRPARASTEAPAAPSPAAARSDEAPEESPRDTGPEAAPAAARPRVPASGLDTAALRRAWPDVLREIKTVNPADSKLLADTEVDLDGDTIVVEFPSDQRVPMKVASEQEKTARLREAVERVTGVRAAIRYQMGRGAVRKEPEQPAPAEMPSEPPAAPADDAPRPAADQGHEVTSRSADVERLLIDELGAEVISDGGPEG